MNETESAPLAPVALPFTRQHLRLVGLVAVCLFAFFWRLGSVPLFDLDEALYVTCARQMVQTGDWTTPRLNSRPLDRPEVRRVAFYEKPIFVYWAAASGLRLFGGSELAARIPSALAALLTTAALTLAGIKWFGPRTGILAGLLFATSPLTIVDARQMTTDGLLVLWTTLAMFAFWNVRTAPPDDKKRAFVHALLFWIYCALAALTKGIVLLLPLVTVSLFLLLRFAPLGLNPLKDVWGNLRRMQPVLGLILFLAIAAPWYVTLAKTTEPDAQGRTFVQEYFIRQHIGRFKGGDKVHNAPLPTYFLYFLIGFFPWACFAPAAFLHKDRAVPGKRRRGQEKSVPPEILPAETLPAADFPSLYRFLLVWFWVIFGFYTPAAAKLPTYLAPAYPAAALLVGRWLDRAILGGAKRPLVVGSFVATLTAALLLAAGIFGPNFVPPTSPLPEEVVSLVRLLTGILFAGCVFALVCFLADTLLSRRLGIGALFAMLLLFIGVTTTQGYTVAEQNILAPYQQLAAKANNLGADATQVVYYNIVPRRPSMLFYSRYSPIERKEKPLLPFLRPLLTSEKPVVVITSRRTYTNDLSAELTAAPDLQTTPLSTTGTLSEGWVLLRITPTPKSPP